MNHVKALLAFIVSVCLLIGLAGRHHEEQAASQPQPVKVQPEQTPDKPLRVTVRA
ncbi:MAG: hypothetical protein QM639_15875 [Rhodocyclaceae bacterium]